MKMNRSHPYVHVRLVCAGALAGLVSAGCASRDLAYRDLLLARQAVESKGGAAEDKWTAPEPKQVKALRDDDWRWPYSGVNASAVLARVSPPGTKDAPYVWPLRIAVVTYDYAGNDNHNPQSGGDECLILDNNFQAFPAVLAAHGLYFDLRKTGAFETVHFEPDSVASYDVVLRARTAHGQKGRFVLCVDWSGEELRGAAEATVHKEGAGAYATELQQDPEEAYEDLSDAIESTSRKAVAALGSWLRRHATHDLAVLRARREIAYFTYFDEQYERLSEVLQAAQTAGRGAWADEEVGRRRAVLTVCRAIEGEMCAAASLGKRAAICEQLRAKEPLDAQVCEYNDAIKRQKRAARFATAMSYVNAAAGGVSSGLSQAAYVRTGNPYYLQQALFTQQQTIETSRRLMELAAQCRQRAGEITYERNQFVIATFPELERTFRESPYAAFLKEFFEDVDFEHGVQAMRVSARDKYRRTFANCEDLLRQASAHAGS